MKLFSGVFLLALLLCFVGHYPGWFDSGEFAAAAPLLGVSHPSGHPTYLLLAHPAVWVPLGSAAFRTAAVSAVSGAFAAVLFWMILEELVGRRAFLGPLLAAAILLHPSVGLQVTRTEVYAPQFALFAAMVLCAARYLRISDTRLLLGISFLAGLAFALHPLLTSAVLPAMLLLILSGPRPWAKKIGASALLFGLGALTYLYLPLRAFAEPWLNWSDPVRWKRFWAALTALDYGVFSHLAASPGAPRDWFASAAFRALPVPLLAAAGVGLFIFWRARGLRFLSFFTLLLACCCLPALAVGFWLNNPDSHGYLVPPLGLVLLFSALSYDWLARRAAASALRPARYAPRIVLLSALALLVPRGLESWRAHAAVETDILSRHLDLAPPRSVLLLGSDHWLFPIWYRQLIENRRPDVTVAAKGMLSASWYRKQVERWFGQAPAAQFFEESAEKTKRRPWGLLLGDAAFDGPLPHRFFRECARVSDSDPFQIRGAVCTQVALATAAGIAADQRGVGEAISLLEAFLGEAPTHISCYPLATIDLPYPLYDRVDFLSEPGRAVSGLARYYLACGRPDIALALLERRTGDADARLLQAFLLWRRGDGEEAQRVLAEEKSVSRSARPLLGRAARILRSLDDRH